MDRIEGRIRLVEERCSDRKRRVGAIAGRMGVSSREWERAKHEWRIARRRAERMRRRAREEERDIETETGWRATA